MDEQQEEDVEKQAWRYGLNRDDGGFNVLQAYCNLVIESMMPLLMPPQLFHSTHEAKAKHSTCLLLTACRPYRRCIPCPSTVQSLVPGSYQASCHRR